MTKNEENTIIAQALNILAGRVIGSNVLTSPAVARDYLIVALAGKEHEAFCVLYLTSQHQVIAFEELFRGTIDSAAVYPREVIKAALAHNAAAVIFAHNHPSGVAEPSSADRRITERLVAGLALLDIRVLDHMIIGGTTVFSFAEQGLL
jgi:DNA repair protein RadC